MKRVLLLLLSVAACTPPRGPSPCDAPVIARAAALPADSVPPALRDSVTAAHAACGASYVQRERQQSHELLILGLGLVVVGAIGWAVSGH